MIIGFLTRAEFAKHCDISAPAVTKAVRAKRIKIDRPTGKVNPNDPVNIDFVLQLVDKGKQISRDLADVIAENFNPSEKLSPPEKEARIKEQSKVRPLRRSRSASPRDDDPDDDLERVSFQGPKDELKATQVVLNNIKIAHEMKALIATEMVDRCFGRLSGVISGRLLPLGQRVAPDVGDIYGDKSPEKQLETQVLIEKEVASAIESIQKELSDATDW